MELKRNVIEAKVVKCPLYIIFSELPGHDPRGCVWCSYLIEEGVECAWYEYLTEIIKDEEKIEDSLGLAIIRCANCGTEVKIQLRLSCINCGDEARCPKCDLLHSFFEIREGKYVFAIPAKQWEATMEKNMFLKLFSLSL